jgi:hypothetical protein
MDMSDFDKAIRKGLEFYMKYFFLEIGRAKYFLDRTYPIDIHSVAQSLITLSRFRKTTYTSRLSNFVLEWALKHMQDKEGYFYYQTFPLLVNRIPYMRWSQAWMLLALSSLISPVDSRKGAESALVVTP